MVFVAKVPKDQPFEKSTREAAAFTSISGRKFIGSGRASPGQASLEAELTAAKEREAIKKAQEEVIKKAKEEVIKKAKEEAIKKLKEEAIKRAKLELLRKIELQKRIRLMNFKERQKFLMQQEEIEKELKLKEEARLQKLKIKEEGLTRKEKAFLMQQKLLSTPDSELNRLQRIEKSLLKEGLFERGSRKLLETLEKTGLKVKEKLGPTKIGKTKFGKLLLKEVKVPKQQAISFVSDIGKFVFFGAATPTSTEILSKLPKNTIVKFVGKQRTKGDKIITDVAFVSSGKRIGTARGVTLVAGKIARTITLGQSGKRGIKIPSFKPSEIKLLERERFIGIERAVLIPTRFKVKRAKQGIAIVKRNVKGLLQLGRGKIAQVKGEKFISRGVEFPTGKGIKKVRRGVSVDDFVSISTAFTKKDLSLILGRVITKKGDRIKFIGLLKGTSKFKDKKFFTPQEQALLQKAVQSVISTASASLKSAQVKRLSSSAKALIASRIIKPTPTPKPKVIQKIKPIVKPKPEIIQKQKPISKIRIQGIGKAITLKQVQKQIQKTKQKQKQITKQIQKQKPKQITKQITKQLTKQLQKLGLRMIHLNKAKQQIKGKGIIRIKPIKKIPLVIKPRRKKKAKKKAVKKKKVQAYDVKARPLKKKGQKKRPKLVKVNKVPLTKKKAKNLRNYITDTSLSRTAKIQKTKGKPRKPVRKVPKGYARRTSIKFRSHRIIKGKRKKLSKGTVIERKTRLLDTKQERKGITLRKRMKQITPKKRKVRVKKTIRRRTTKKRSLSQAQLKALSKGREIRIKNLKNKK